MVTAAAVAIVLATFEQRNRGPLRFADGRPLGAVEAPPDGAVLSMSDGSRVNLAGGAQLAPLESTGTSFVAVLERGSAHFEVRPGGPRRWQIECGLATVEVVGTGFDCLRAPGRLTVYRVTNAITGPDGAVGFCVSGLGGRPGSRPRARR